MIDGSVHQEYKIILIAYAPNNKVLKTHEKERPDRTGCPFIEVFPMKLIIE